MRDPRLDNRGRRLAIWNYIISNELQSGSQFVLAQPGGQMYAVIGASHEILRVPSRGGAAWFGYLNEIYGLTEHEPWMTAIHDAFRHYIQRKGAKAEMRRFANYNVQTNTGYLSSYDGRMYKIDGERIARVSNGEDNVFFADDDGGQPCPDPDIGPHGMLLDHLTSPNFAATGLSGITPEQQKKALTLWLFALAFPDLLIDKPILLVEGVMGSGKCLGLGTPVLMFDGSTKPVEKIKNGDLVMGPDSGPRRVSGTTRGRGPLYKIDPTKGAPWICNQDHILTVHLAGHRNKRGQVINRGAIVDAPLQDFSPSQWGSHLKRDYATLVRSGVDFPMTAVPIEPYLVGLWLGDGTCAKPQITNPEPEIMAYCEQVAARYETEDEKRIPRVYLVNDRATRLQLLAGLLDTDGHYFNGHYEIITKYPGLRDDLLFLARSLGLAAYSREKRGVIKALDFEGTYQRITLSGDLDQIPCRVPRKQAAPRRQVKNVLHTGFRIEPIGDGDFYGFELDGDGRFLLGDFTITHNTTTATHIQLVLMGTEEPMVLQRNKEDDFGVILMRSPIALFDNTDSFIDWVPDAIAAYATGGKWHKRKLFTDDENLTIKPQSFVVVATRNPASFRRDDVADRCLILRFDRRPTFSDRGSLKQDLINNRPALFGEYMYYIGQITERIRQAGGLRSRDERFRMASFAALGRVIGAVLGWADDAVSDVLQALQGERDAFVCEEDPLVELLERWISYRTKHAPTNIGRLVNVNVLHAELETFAQSSKIDWKDTPRTLVAKLRSNYVERVFRVEMHNVASQRHFKLWRHTDARLELVPDEGEEVISVPGGDE